MAGLRSILKDPSTWPLMFVVSFSEHDDDLAQWRAYAPSFGGYTIGFAPAALKRPPDSELVQCVYTAIEQRERAKDLFNFLFRFVIIDADTPTGTLQLALRELPFLAASCKHSSFSGEREWRVVLPVGATPSVEFRTSMSRIIPYQSFEFDDRSTTSCIKKIVIGPCPHPLLAEVGIKQILAQDTFLSDVELAPTDTSLRSW